VVDFLIRVGANLNDFFSTRKTLFVEATTCLGQHLSVAQFLLSKGVPQIADGKGTFPIHAASRHHNIDLLRGLIDQGADVNGRDRKGRRPLHHAVQRNAVDVCVFLLESSADIDAVDGHGRTPLHYAVMSGFLQIVELLCDYGANALAVDGDGVRPAVLALRHARLSVAAYFATLGLGDDDEEEDEEIPVRRGGARVSLRGAFPPRKERGRVARQLWY
jgi:ankyrin repeat protein